MSGGIVVLPVLALACSWGLAALSGAAIYEGVAMLMRRMGAQ